MGHGTSVETKRLFRYTMADLAGSSGSTTTGTGAAKLLNTFRRARRPSDATSVSSSHGLYNERRAAQRTAKTNLSRQLKGRHLQMIAIGGSIGKSSSCPLPNAT